VGGLVALRFRDSLNDRQTMLSDPAAMLCIFICDQISGAKCERDFFIRSFSRCDSL
jgi:hypothetical protein